MNERVNQLIALIRSACDELTERTGRPVSPDGHLVGTIGEVFARERFGLTLATASNPGFDAIDNEGRKVEIKTTTQRSIAFSARETEAERLIVLRWPNGATLDVVYDGPMQPVLALTGRRQSNGQRSVSLAKIARLQT